MTLHEQIVRTLTVHYPEVEINYGVGEGVISYMLPSIQYSDLDVLSHIEGMYKDISMTPLMGAIIVAIIVDVRN